MRNCVDRGRGIHEERKGSITDSSPSPPDPLANDEFTGGSRLLG